MTVASDIRIGLWAVIATAVLAAALVLPGQAAAASECADVGSDPTAAQYCSTTEIVPTPPPEAPPPEEESSGTEAASTEYVEPEASESESAESESAPVASGSLPFTGLDLLALVAVAAALTAAGLALHRLSRSKTGMR